MSFPGPTSGMTPSSLGGGALGGSGISAKFTSALQNNPYFDAGFGLAVLGVGMQALRKSSFFLKEFIQRRIFISMEITQKDFAYPWVLKWINDPSRSMAQHVTATTAITASSQGTGTTMFSYTPSPGRHLIRYGHRFISVNRRREAAMMNVNTGEPFECVTLTTFGMNRTIFETILEEAKRDALLDSEDMTMVYASRGHQWEAFGLPRRKRPMDSVILDEGISESILSDVSDFRNNVQWYMNRGIPYRRGYLLHGTPGSGKTSYIQALAGHFGLNLCMLSLGNPYLTDDQLANLMTVIPKDSIVVMEDIDALFIDRSDQADGTTHQRGITFSGLLNVLDGVLAGEERLVFMTTNHLERLDRALVRPGRIDVVMEIGGATENQIRRMFLKFYQSQTSSADLVAKQLSGLNISMAELQGYLMLYKGDPDAALNGIGALAEGLRQRNLKNSQGPTSSTQELHRKAKI
eukprot:516242_1